MLRSIIDIAASHQRLSSLRGAQSRRRSDPASRIDAGLLRFAGNDDADFAIML
jgi:hypothetical protein